jgi:hypothetical protein
MAEQTIRKIAAPNLPVAPAEYEPRWMDQFSNVLRLFFATVVNTVNADEDTDNMAVYDGLNLTDGVTAPSTVLGVGIIYIDSADGDLKIKFGDGTVKTIVTD